MDNWDLKNFNKRKFTKENIVWLAHEIEKLLIAHNLQDDIRIYYNNKCIDFNSNGLSNIIEDINPTQYCQYVPNNHILTITSEGSLYNFYNTEYSLPTELNELVNLCGLYFECCASWCWSLFSDNDTMEIEYTVYEKPQEPKWLIYGRWDNVPKPIQHIMEYWYECSKDTGDIGGCVLGAKMEFWYKNIYYKMAPCSCWQGEGSWVPHVDIIKQMLKSIGCTNIEWYCGILD